jgi:AcrR family transcriptional regulator
VSTGRVLEYPQALRCARRLFAETAGVDMDELAHRLAVSRATLYRVVGSRDRVLGDVLAHAGERIARAALADAQGSGAERLLDAAARFNAALVAAEPLRRLLREDPPTAFRVLFTPEPGVHRRAVQLWAGFFAQARADDGFSHPLGDEELAFVFVRIGESIIYADLLAELEPDLALAAKVQRAVLLAV